MQSESNGQIDTAIAFPLLPEATDELEVDSRPLPYTICTEGSLTYFDFNYENAGFTNLIVDDPESGSNSVLLSRSLIGTGAMAALVLGGLAVGEAISQPNSAQPKSSEIKLKQPTAEDLPQPKITAPEKSAPEKSPTKPQAPVLTKTRVKQLQSLSQPFSPQDYPLAQLITPITFPETLGSKRSPGSGLTGKVSSSAQKAQASTVSNSTSNPTNAQLNSGAPTAIPTVISPPERTEPQRLPVSLVEEVAGTKSQPDSELQPGNTAILQPETLSSTKPRVLEQPVEQITEGNGKSDLPLIKSRSQPNKVISDRQQTLNTALNSADVSYTASLSKDGASAGNKAISTNPQSIKDYVTLTQKSLSPQMVALMPLTRQAAEEAAASTQIGKYTVRQVDIAEYQKEWVTSNNASNPEIAIGFPAYGFIDYQRQVIVLLRELTTAKTI